MPVTTSSPLSLQMIITSVLIGTSCPIPSTLTDANLAW